MLCPFAFAIFRCCVVCVSCRWFGSVGVHVGVRRGGEFVRTSVCLLLSSCLLFVLDFVVCEVIVVE